jgi:hypothetical protein
MVSAYQVFAQPVFQTIEDILIGWFPRLQFANKHAEFGLRFGYRWAPLCVM